MQLYLLSFTPTGSAPDSKVHYHFYCCSFYIAMGMYIMLSIRIQTNKSFLHIHSHETRHD